MTREQKDSIRTVIFSGVLPFVIAIVSVLIAHRMQASDLDAREFQIQLDNKATKEELETLRKETKEHNEWQKERIMVEIEWIKSTLIDIKKGMDKDTRK